jgi:hypothetical protein
LSRPKLKIEGFLRVWQDPEHMEKVLEEREKVRQRNAETARKVFEQWEGREAELWETVPWQYRSSRVSNGDLKTQ